MNSFGGVPLGEIPLALVSRRCLDGHVLGFSAALARLHIGLSHTPEFGDGSIILRSGWRSFWMGTLGMAERTTVTVKGELLLHGGVTISGQRHNVITVDGRETRVRSINRGICRMIIERLADEGDGPRTDTLAAAVLIAIDLFLRGRLEGGVCEGRVHLHELAEAFDTTRETARHALHRLVACGLLETTRGRSRGISLGIPPLVYRLSLPSDWLGAHNHAASESITSVSAAACQAAARQAASTAVFRTPDPTERRISAPPYDPSGGFLHPSIEEQTSGPRLAFSVRIHMPYFQSVTSPKPAMPPASSPTPDEAAGVHDRVSDGFLHPELDARRFSAPPPMADRRICAPPRGPTQRNTAPQEMSGDLEEREGVETPPSALPPIPPDHSEQMSISADLWPRQLSVLDSLTANGIRLEPTAHLAHVLRDLAVEQVLDASQHQRIEDAWDLRVVLYRAGVRRSVEGLWHTDIEATLSECDVSLRRVCVTNTEARNEWLDLFARAGLRLCGILALNDFLFPRSRVAETQSRYIRFYESAVRDWARTRASSPHTVMPPEATKHTAARSSATGPMTRTEHEQALPSSTRDAVYQTALSDTERVEQRLWLYHGKNVLLRLTNGQVVCRYRTSTTLNHLQALGFIDRIESAVRKVVAGTVSVRSDAHGAVAQPSS